jgi:hypothetical protein
MHVHISNRSKVSTTATDAPDREAVAYARRALSCFAPEHLKNTRGSRSRRSNERVSKQ